LAPEVVAILKRRLRDTPPDGYVFPGRLKGRPMTDFTKPFKAILTAAEIPTTGPDVFRFHDLRRSLSSYMSDSGSDYLRTTLALGQKPEGVNSVYTRPKPETLRDAVAKGVAAILACKPITSTGSGDSHDGQENQPQGSGKKAGRKTATSKDAAGV
jgi:integrase